MEKGATAAMRMTIPLLFLRCCGTCCFLQQSPASNDIAACLLLLATVARFKMASPLTATGKGPTVSGHGGRSESRYEFID
jgi:hypothetical protein